MGSIGKKVSDLIKKYGTSNPFEIAEAMGIEVVYEYLGDLSGYYSKFNRTAIIHINDSLPYKRQFSTCSHELGHAILHAEVNTAFLKANTFYPTSRIENEANEFMIELLFSREGQKSITINEAVEHYGISEQLLFKFFYTKNQTYIP